jgi:hypothetical protein
LAGVMLRPVVFVGVIACSRWAIGFLIGAAITGMVANG